MSGGPDNPRPTDWRPSADLDALRLRAALLGRVRAFFAERGVLEVETPALAHAGASDPHIESLRTAGGTAGPLYLQTSPEYAMKRLLAAGSGPIYQICRAFRDGERGRLHNPEFTLLEWYRPGFDHHRLMDELEDLVAALLGAGPPARRVGYGEAFRAATGMDPHAAGVDALRARARDEGLDTSGDDPREYDTLLEFLFSHTVQPALGPGRVFVYDFPASQAALARVREGDPPVGERFELFVDGVEIANGYHELGDAGEQRRRFAADAGARARLGLEPVPPDERLLDALAHGLPDCAGVAVGLDRLFMIAAGATGIDAVIAFPLDRA